MENNKKFWERVACLYSPMQERSNSELYKKVIDSCKKHLTLQDNVLELACGTGQFTFDLCKLTSSWEATDYSKKMVCELSKRIPNDVKGKITTSVQDATALPYNNESFDVIFMANALHIMPEPIKALAEILRVLKPSGRLIVPTFVYEGGINRFRLWLLDKVGFKTYNEWTLEELETYLSRNGFKVIESKVIEGKLLPEGFVVCKKK